MCFAGSLTAAKIEQRQSGPGHHPACDGKHLLIAAGYKVLKGRPVVELERQR
jgi:hypothetical protein